MPTERPPLLGEVVPTFADRGCCVVSATNPPGRIMRRVNNIKIHKTITVSVVVYDMKLVSDKAENTD
jgi:hypothetical protein